jgi:hypothetical protein
MTQAGWRSTTTSLAVPSAAVAPSSAAGADAKASSTGGKNSCSVSKWHRRTGSSSSRSHAFREADDEPRMKGATDSTRRSTDSIQERYG